MSVVGTCQITDIVPHLYIKIVSSTSNGDTLLIRQLGGPSRRLYLALKMSSCHGHGRKERLSLPLSRHRKDDAMDKENQDLEG